MPVPRAATFVVTVLAVLCAPLMAAAQRLVPHPEWAAVFDSAHARGVFVLQKLGSTSVDASDTVRARRAYLPASTFKIPNSLIALELGIVRDERQRFPMTWPTQEIAAWNREHSFQTALKYSVVPVYQRIARQVGERRYRQWLARLDYGNRDPGGGVDRFWLDGALRISALEQLGFLSKLATRALPLSERSQRIVQAMLVRQANDCFTLRAKTGLVGVQPQASIPDDQHVGWYVGSVETDDASWVFALNLDVHSMVDANARIPLARALLARAGVTQARGCDG